MTAERFTTRGNVRGSCRHCHRSVETAARCLDRDIRACRKLGGYSDRNVYAVPPRDLTEREKDIVTRELNRGY